MDNERKERYSALPSASGRNVGVDVGGLSAAWPPNKLQVRIHKRSLNHIHTIRSHPDIRYKCGAIQDPNCEKATNSWRCCRKRGSQPQMVTSCTLQ